MNCYKHKDIEVIAMCAECGNCICNDCRLNIDNKNTCKDCFEKQKISYNNKRAYISINNLINGTSINIAGIYFTFLMMFGLLSTFRYELNIGIFEEFTLARGLALASFLIVVVSVVNIFTKVTKEVKIGLLALEIVIMIFSAIKLSIIYKFLFIPNIIFCILFMDHCPNEKLNINTDNIIKGCNLGALLVGVIALLIQIVSFINIITYFFGNFIYLGRLLFMSILKIIFLAISVALSAITILDNNSYNKKHIRILAVSVPVILMIIFKVIGKLMVVKNSIDLFILIEFISIVTLFIVPIILENKNEILG